MTHILDDLKARGLIEQCSDEAALREHLSQAPRTLYCGVDPSADSMHIGHLVPFITMARFQNAGHRPLALIGGSTGMIGDPSFKDAERQLLTADVVEQNANSLSKQIKKLFLSASNGKDVEVVNNIDWAKPLSVIDFLRDIGKSFSVNAMINKESVKQRLNREGSGLSFTEFTYSILQSMDFAYLNKTYDCTLQIGGSDQWGNMVGGIDLSRRQNGQQVFILTMPLITKADGKKFGKSESGAVWIDPAKTSPYAMYQFWMNTADADVEKLLKIYTFMDVAEIEALAKEHMETPHLRLGQKRLAQEVTKMVHGEEALESAERITQALFGGSLDALTEADLAQLSLDGMPSTKVENDQFALIDALVETKLASSNREARDFIKGNAVSSNGEKITDIEGALTNEKALYGKYHVLKRGKKNYHLLELGV